MVVDFEFIGFLVLENVPAFDISVIDFDGLVLQVSEGRINIIVNLHDF